MIGQRRSVSLVAPRGLETSFLTLFIVYGEPRHILE